MKRCARGGPSCPRAPGPRSSFSPPTRPPALGLVLTCPHVSVPAFPSQLTHRAASAVADSPEAQKGGDGTHDEPARRQGTARAQPTPAASPSAPSAVNTTQPTRPVWARTSSRAEGNHGHLRGPETLSDLLKVTQQIKARTGTPTALFTVTQGVARSLGEATADHGPSRGPVLLSRENDAWLGSDCMGPPRAPSPSCKPQRGTSPGHRARDVTERAAVWGGRG